MDDKQGGHAPPQGQAPPLCRKSLYLLGFEKVKEDLLCIVGKPKEGESDRGGQIEIKM